jgi:hypothetical protein
MNTELKQVHLTLLIFTFIIFSHSLHYLQIPILINQMIDKHYFLIYMYTILFYHLNLNFLYQLYLQFVQSYMKRIIYISNFFLY